jgi:murein DD-endopeptidase MepM/ murein hydrolase activator NlpD
MVKGNVDIAMNYDETIIGTTLLGNNINIKSNNNTTLISTDILALVNLNIEADNNLLVGTAEERHESQEDHESFGGDMGKAALGGAVIGLATGLGVQGGEIAGNFTGNAIGNTIGGTGGKILGTATSSAVNSSIVSLGTITGSAMSQVTIQGGSLSDVLKAGEDSITDKDTLKNVAISGLTAGLTTGLTSYINTATNGTISAGNTANATFSQQLKTSLYESAISTTTNTAVQSAVNGDSFTETLEHQGINTLVGALGNLGAKQIGSNYHSGNINKTTQLTLHAGLGATTAVLTGNDALSGAVSGISGELFAELLRNTMYNNTTDLNQDQKNTLKEYGGLAGGLSALITGKLTGLDNEEITDNIYAGQRVGKNAVENNLLYDQLMWDTRVTSEYGKIRNIKGVIREHKGVDTITTDDNKTVHSAADGTVVGTGYHETGWGNHLAVESFKDGERYLIWYAHLKEEPDIPVGTEIKEGQPIGTMGNTGRSTGAHLHFEIKQQNKQNGEWFHINPALINLGNYEYLGEIYGNK